MLWIILFYSKFDKHLSVSPFQLNTDHLLQSTSSNQKKKKKLVLISEQYSGQDGQMIAFESQIISFLASNSVFWLNSLTPGEEDINSNLKWERTCM